jgi:hypothetical protein
MINDFDDTKIYDMGLLSTGSCNLAGGSKSATIINNYHLFGQPFS